MSRPASRPFAKRAWRSVPAGIATFYAELKRRRVFKVAVAYAVVAWLLMQAAATVFPALHLPFWTVTLVHVLLIAGFPVAMLLAWAYDLTPSGVQLTEPTEEPTTTTAGDVSANRDSARLAAPRAATAPPDANSALASVAVLPFKNLVTEGRYAHLADAIAVELHSLLSRLHEVRVVPRQSSAAHGGTERSLTRIADELNVQYVISGSVSELDHRIRVTADLNDATADTLLWSEQYEVTIDELWETERRIVESIVSTFGGERLRAEIRRAVAAPPANASAWQLVQRARAYVLDYQAETLREAVPLLARAVELDAGYASAHASLGLVTAELALNGLSADPAADREAALESIRRAEKLAPRDPAVLRAAGSVYAYTGAYRRSLEVLRRAVKLAPYDLGTWGYMGWPLVASGSSAHLEELERILERLVANAPKHPGLAYWRFHQSVAAACADRCEQGLGYVEECTAEQPRFSLGWMHTANLLGRLDRHTEAREAADRSRDANASMTPQYYVELMAVLSDQPAVVERRTAGLRAAALLDA